MENHKKECKHGKQQQEIEDRIREEQERNRQNDNSDNDDEAEAWEIIDEAEAQGMEERP